MKTIRSTPRLGELYRGGARYVCSERNGEWGVAGVTLEILLLRLRGESWHFGRIYRLTEGGPVPVPSGEIVRAAEKVAERSSA
jgi:hypothetical protein